MQKETRNRKVYLAEQVNQWRKLVFLFKILVTFLQPSDKEMKS